MTQAPTPSTAEVTWERRTRQSAFEAWLAPLVDTVGLRAQTLRPASSDASFRRYLRIDGTGGSFIVMDAPPSHEDVRPFIAVADLIHQAGLHAPKVLAQDTQNGFLLLSDLGSTLYLAELRAAVLAEDTASIERLMRGAFSALVVWQQRVDASSLPSYDGALLRRELALFPEWCVRREFGVTWGADEQATWATTTDLLAGRTQLILGGLVPLQPYIQAGRLRPIAVTTAKRWHSLPDVAAMAEALPGYEVESWFGIVMPKGVPPAVLERMNAAANKILRDPDVKKNLEGEGMAIVGGSTEQFSKRIRNDHTRWVKLVREAKLKGE